MARENKNNTDRINSRGRRTFNIGMIIFGAILIYMIATLILYFTANHVTSYEVQQGKLAKNTSFTGVVIRDETVETAPSSGYIAYYQTEAKKVKNGSNIYSIDTTGSTTKTLKAYSNESTLTTANINTLESNLADFQKTMSSSDFESAYDFRYKLESELLDIHSESIIKQLDTFSSYDSASFSVCKAPLDGVIVYSVDGLEGLTTDTITEDILDNKSAYNKTDLRENTDVSAGDPVYKLVTDENWSVCIRPDDDTWNYLSENNISEIQVRVKKDNELLWANVSRIDDNGNGDRLVKLSFDNSMVRYISDRYLDIDLIIQDETGLKIPRSAIVSKQFYLVPDSFIGKGGDSSSQGVLLRSSDKSGSLATVFKAATVYYVDTDTGMAYIDKSILKDGDILIHPDQSQTYVVGETATLDGVYCVNKGYAVFKEIQALYGNDEYCIAKEGTDYGLSNYDFIALKGSSVKENDIVY